MFDIGWTELLVIGVVALIVVGPKDLPIMFHRLGQFTAKARGMAREFQRAMDDAAKEAGVKDVSRDLRNLTSPTRLGLDKLKEATRELASIDPKRGPATQKLSEERAAKAAQVREATAAAATRRKAAEAEKEAAAAKAGAAASPASVAEAAKPGTAAGPAKEAVARQAATAAGPADGTAAKAGGAARKPAARAAKGNGAAKKPAAKAAKADGATAKAAGKARAAKPRAPKAGQADAKTGG